MKDSYLERLKNILDSVEDCGSDDMSFVELKDLTIEVLKNSIEREEAYQDIDGFDEFIFSKLEMYNEEVEEDGL